MGSAGCGAVKPSIGPAEEEELPDGVDPEVMQMFQNEAKRTEEIKNDKDLIQKILEAQRLASQGDTKQLEIMRKEEADRKIKSNSQILDVLWKRFDKDGNGNMDTDELLTILNVYLRTAKHWLASTIVTATMRRLKAEIKQSKKDMSDGQEKHIKMVLDGHANTILEAWVKEKASIDIAKKMYDTMDKNKDGKIEHPEFVAEFMNALDRDVCCSEKSRVIAKRVLFHHAYHCPSSSSSSSSSSSLYFSSIIHPSSFIPSSSSQHHESINRRHH